MKCLDVSGMIIVQTEDGYYRYCFHPQKILTVGFKTRAGLERNRDIFREDARTIRIMRRRYRKMRGQARRMK